jgi:hypothetical protein
VKKVLATAAFLLVLAPVAWAAHPAVSPDEQQHLKMIMGMFGSDDLAYVPGLLPANYGMSRTQTVANQLTVTFTNNKYADGSAKSNASALNFAAQLFNGKLASCSKGSNGSRVVAGKTVYLKAQAAWRCLRAPSGHLVVVFANSPTLSYAELARVIASAVHIS